jgi:hypothetical protein
VIKQVETKNGNNWQSGIVQFFLALKGQKMSAAETGAPGNVLRRRPMIGCYDRVKYRSPAGLER